MTEINAIEAWERNRPHRVANDLTRIKFLAMALTSKLLDEDVCLRDCAEDAAMLSRMLHATADSMEMVNGR